MLIFNARFEVLTNFQYLVKPEFFYTFILFYKENLFISPTAKWYSALVNTVYNNINNNVQAYIALFLEIQQRFTIFTIKISK